MRFSCCPLGKAAGEGYLNAIFALFSCSPFMPAPKRFSKKSIDNAVIDDLTNHF